MTCGLESRVSAFVRCFCVCSSVRSFVRSFVCYSRVSTPLSPQPKVVTIFQKIGQSKQVYEALKFLQVPACQRWVLVFLLVYSP